MDPITAGLVVGGTSSLISGGLNMWGASKAQAAYEDAMRKLQQMIENEWEVPEFERFTPQEYQLLSIYNPEIAQYIQESAPQLLNEAASQGLINKQNQVLSKMEGQIAEGGEDAVSRAENAKLASEADAQRRSSRNNLLADYGRRGLAGSADEMLADAASVDSVNEQQYLGSLQNAANAQRRKADLLNQYSGTLGSMRGQNLAVESQNANTTNSFNERMTRNLNQYNQYMAQQRNDAQLYNNNNRQNISNANIDLRNNSDMENYRRRMNITNLKNQKVMAKAGMAQQQADMGGRFAQAGIDRLSGMVGGIGSAVGQGLMMYGAGKGSPKPPMQPQQQLYSNNPNMQLYGPGYGFKQ